MNIEDLKLDDKVAAKCLHCGEMHHWLVAGLNLAPRVALHVEPYDVCECKRQVVYAAGIEGKVV